MKKDPEHKARLKHLREERSQWIGHAREQIKTANQMFKKIKPVIKDTAMTVPQIAQAIDEPSARVLIYLSALKKFGMAQEVGKEGDYYTYRLSS